MTIISIVIMITMGIMIIIVMIITTVIIMKMIILMIIILIKNHINVNDNDAGDADNYGDSNIRN